MALTFVYPTAAEMVAIVPELNARAKADRVGLQLFPVMPRKTFFVRWTQKDNYYGLMQMRGLDGAPPKVSRLGSQTFVYEPGVYGEHITITEREWVTRANALDMTQPIDITQEVLDDMALLVNRKWDRMEYNVWTLLSTGTIQIPLPGPSGQLVYKDTYPIQKYSASIPWGTTATATPLADMQAMQQKSVGHGVKFGPEATLYINQVKANQLFNNTNAADFGGRKVQGGNTINDIASFNLYFTTQGLPKIQIYDEGFQISPLSGPITSAATQYQKFIDSNTGILVGKRTGNEPVGEWQQTMQVLQPGAAGPGEYSFVKNYATGINAPVEVPPKLEIHHGFNGGLSIFYPSAVVSSTI